MPPFGAPVVRLHSPTVHGSRKHQFVPIFTARRPLPVLSFLCSAACLEHSAAAFSPSQAVCLSFALFLLPNRRYSTVPIRDPAANRPEHISTHTNSTTSNTPNKRRSVLHVVAVSSKETVRTEFRAPGGRSSGFPLFTPNTLQDNATILVDTLLSIVLDTLAYHIDSDRISIYDCLHIYSYCCIRVCSSNSIYTFGNYTVSTAMGSATVIEDDLHRQKPTAKKEKRVEASSKVQGLASLPRMWNRSLCDELRRRISRL
ncbi:hypothetical protein CNMCM6106_007394 [Aspergillus hiratsukae]|uniref:Uncharacterized protein n=1 Tax=Aspergillus hiratsukae TaxID=1194566 RepID=A0A8H6PTQ6_9EURO|nr:hypothetical protein CNMCM6106_007394 [Aspergillus hiratsukae]